MTYADAVERFDELLARARPTLAGLTACVDVVTRLDDALLQRIRAADESAGARAFVELLVDHGLRGRGGERLVRWADGPRVLDAVAGGRRAIGGTGAQAAQTLGRLGAPAVLCLADRSQDLLALLAPDVLLVDDGGERPVRAVAPQRPASRRTPHYIFEFVAGQALAGRRVPRSSRLIVRFDYADLEADAGFDEAAERLAGTAGAATISGFNSLPPARRAAAHARGRRVAAAWRSGGLETIHLELGATEDPADALLTCEQLAGVVTSIGMSQSELLALAPDAVAFADRHDVETVIVHGDRRSYAVTADDPDRIGEALLVGNLLAATRAARGEPARPEPGLLPLPSTGWSCERLDAGRTLVSSPSPYLPEARSTIGLGDTFVAGLMLALGATTPTLSNPRSIRS